MLEDRSRLSRTTSDLPPDAIQDEKATKRAYYSDVDAIAYASCRMPNTYAASSRVFHELSSRLPSFSPESHLDFGAGTGAAVWAAKRVWSESIKQTLGVDTATTMTDVARELLQGPDGPLLNGVEFFNDLPAKNSPKVNLLRREAPYGRQVTLFYLAVLWARECSLRTK